MCKCKTSGSVALTWMPRAGERLKPPSTDVGLQEDSILATVILRRILQNSLAVCYFGSEILMTLQLQPLGSSFILIKVYLWPFAGRFSVHIVRSCVPVITETQNKIFLYGYMVVLCSISVSHLLLTLWLGNEYVAF